MKVEINSQALADAVAWTTRVIDARPATPILAGVHTSNHNSHRSENHPSTLYIF